MWHSSVRVLCFLISNIFVALIMIASSDCSSSHMNRSWQSEPKYSILRPDLWSQWNRGSLDRKYRGMLSGGTGVEFRQSVFQIRRHIL